VDFRLFIYEWNQTERKLWLLDSILITRWMTLQRRKIKRRGGCRYYLRPVEPCKGFFSQTENSIAGTKRGKIGARS